MATPWSLRTALSPPGGPHPSQGPQKMTRGFSAESGWYDLHERGGHRKGVICRLEFELGAGFEGFCGFALVLALSQMMEHGLGSFGCAHLHPRRNPLDRQGRFAPQPGRDRKSVAQAKTAEL